MDMDIRPIATEADYDWALTEITLYFEQEPKQGTPEAERFDVLAALIEHYEAKHWPIEAPDAVEAIRFRMEQGGFNQADLGRVLGSRSRASEVLSRKRELTLEQIQALHREWKLPLEALMKTSSTINQTAHAEAVGNTIKVMREDLVIGKREVEAGGVRVTSHVVETPVQEQVTLHEERVTIDRRPVNERVSSADAFRDQTIEARATAEEAVIGKDVRVVEEIALRKQAADRVETVRDSVRETKVDVENTSTSMWASSTIAPKAR